MHLGKQDHWVTRRFGVSNFESFLHRTYNHPKLFEATIRRETCTKQMVMNLGKAITFRFDKDLYPQREGRQRRSVKKVLQKLLLPILKATDEG